MLVYEYSLPCDTRIWKERKGLIVQTEVGFGEIAPLPGFSKETLEEAKEDLFKIEPTLPSVRWGLACAHRPLKPIRIPLCSLGPREGFSTHKLKLGHLSLSDAILFVREYVGKAHLRLDCNRSWTLEQALEFASHFKPTDFAYLEEPVQTMEELIQFSKRSGFPIALDESIQCNWNEIPTLKAIVVKPTVVGSIPKLPPHLDLVLSSSYESGLGLLHIAMAAQNSLPIGLDTYRAFLDDLLLEPIDCSNGYFSWNGSSPPINLAKMTPLLTI